MDNAISRITFAIEKYEIMIEWTYLKAIGLSSSKMARSCPSVMLFRGDRLSQPGCIRIFVTDTGSGTSSLVLYTRIIINIHVYILQNIRTRVYVIEYWDTCIYITCQWHPRRCWAGHQTYGDTRGDIVFWRSPLGTLTARVHDMF